MDIINEEFINTKYYLIQNKFDNESDFISINSDADLMNMCFVIKELMIKLVEEFNVDFILKCPFDPRNKQINLKEVKVVTEGQLSDAKETSYDQEEKFDRSRNIIRSYMEIKLDNLELLKPTNNNIVMNTNTIMQLQNLENPRYIIRKTNENMEIDNKNDKEIEKEVPKKGKKRSKIFKNNNKLNLSNNINKLNINNISNSRNIENDDSYSSYNSSKRQNSHKFDDEYNPNHFKQSSKKKNEEGFPLRKKKSNNLNINVDTPLTDKDSFANGNGKLANNSYSKKLEFNEPCREIYNLK